MYPVHIYVNVYTFHIKTSNTSNCSYTANRVKILVNMLPAHIQTSGKMCAFYIKATNTSNSSHSAKMIHNIYEYVHLQHQDF